MTASGVVLTEIKLGSADWANISTDVRTENEITIKRGRSDEQSSASPSELTISINNKDGKYSPRNPVSPIYGQIGRNTPIRVSLGRGRYGMVVAGAGRAETPDSVPLSITGDIDIRVELEPDAAWSSLNMDLASKFAFFTNQLGWSLLTVAGRLRLNWWAGASAPPTMQAESSVVIPGSGRQAIRVTLDVDNGAAGNTATFYTAPGIAGPWTQFGTTIVQAGVTSIFDNAIPVRIGAASAATSYSHGHSEGTFYKAEIRSGIGGTVVASPNFEAQPLDPVPFGLSSFNDAQGNTWSFTGTADAARIWYGNIAVRFVGEIAELPPRWDASGKNRWVPIKASGLLRRIGQGSQPVNNGYKTYLLGTSPVTYWPLDDPDTALSGAPAKGTYTKSVFERALDTTVCTFGQGDLGPQLPPALRINDTNPGAADFMSGLCIGTDTTPDSLAMDFLYRRNPIVSGQKMTVWTIRLFVYGTGSGDPSDGNFDLWEVQFRSDGTNNDIRVVLDMDAFAVAGGPTVVTLNDSAPLECITDLGLHHVRLQLTPSGADVNYTVYVDGVSVVTGTRAGYTLRNARTVWVLYDRLANEDMLALGHVIVWENLANIPAVVYTSNLAHSFIGEAAGRRFERLCSEVGVPFAGVGNLDDSMPMGAQFSDYFSNQLTEIEATDRGVMFEPRDALALSYRPRRNLYNQAPKATINYGAGQLSPPFEPVDDDQATRNDIFAQRREGGSFQATKTTGPLSVQDPPNGVGRYKDEQQVNVESDGLLPGLADWLLLAGTLDAARFPSVTVNLAAPDVDSTLKAALLSVDVGDRLVVTNAAAVNLYDDLSLLVLGYEETIGPVEHTISFNCAPAVPYEVAVYDSAKYDTDGSRLVSGVNSTATTLSVEATGTSLWTTDAAAFPFDINVAGERMTVTNITSATSPQSFTVTRSVNGVVKAQAAAADVRLWSTPRYAL